MIALTALGLLQVNLSKPETDMFWLCDGLERFESPVKIVPGPKLRVVAERAEIVSTQKTEIEVQPNLPGLKSITECALIAAEGTLATGYGTSRQPVPILNLPILKEEQRVVYYGLIAGKQTKLGEYRVQLNPSVSPVSLQLLGTRVIPSSTSGDVLVFYGQEFLGRSRASTFGIDTRRLIPGYHEFFTVPLLNGGAIGPMAMSEIWIPSRWKLDYPPGLISVEKSTLSAKVEFTSKLDTKIKRTWITVDGVKSGSLATGNGAIDLDLRYLPTGIHIVGINAECDDSRLVAPEFFKLSVINPVLDAEKAHNRRLGELERRFSSVRRLDQDVVDLYEQALRAPEATSVTFTTRLVSVSEWGSVASATLIDKWQLPGDAGRLMGLCKRKLLERASERVEIAKLLIQLGRTAEAKSWLNDAIADAGGSSATSTEAKNILVTLH